MKSKFLVNRVLAILFAGFIFTISANIYAQEVPANLQAALFKKIFGFNKTLQAKGSFEVSVIGKGADEIVKAFSGAGINAKAAGDQIPAGAQVVYLMPGVSSTKSQTASKGIFSISGVASLAEEGKVSVAIGTEGGKPKIIVHLGQLKAEGNELSADLLKIAKVIQ